MKKRIRIQRSGAVIICVMVVLLLVGLLTMQAMQTLMLIRRNDSRRSNLRQARELVQFGRMVASGTQAEVETEWTVQVSPTESGVIQFWPGDQPVSDAARIEARFPDREVGAAVASWNAKHQGFDNED